MLTWFTVPLPWYRDIWRPADTFMLWHWFAIPLTLYAACLQMHVPPPLFEVNCVNRLLHMIASATSNSTAGMTQERGAAQWASFCDLADRLGLWPQDRLAIVLSPQSKCLMVHLQAIATSGIRSLAVQVHPNSLLENRQGPTSGYVIKCVHPRKGTCHLCELLSSATSNHWLSQSSEEITSLLDSEPSLFAAGCQRHNLSGRHGASLQGRCDGSGSAMCHDANFHCASHNGGGKDPQWPSRE